MSINKYWNKGLYFFKTYFLELFGIISILDTLWSFAEKIFDVIILIIKLLFKSGPNIKDMVCSDSSKPESNKPKSSVQLIREEILRKKLADYSEAVEDTQSSKTRKGTRQ